MSGNRNTPKHRKQKNKSPQMQVQQQTIEQKIHHGPIPAPEDLAKYNSIISGAAERILAMAESEVEHRQRQEVDTLNANISDRASARTEIKLGQILAFILCLTVIGCGTFIAINGAIWPGVILSTAGLSGIIAAYLKK